MKTGSFYLWSSIHGSVLWVIVFNIKGWDMLVGIFQNEAWLSGSSNITEFQLSTSRVTVRHTWGLQAKCSIWIMCLFHLSQILFIKKIWITTFRDWKLSHWVRKTNLWSSCIHNGFSHAGKKRIPGAITRSSLYIMQWNLYTRKEGLYIETLND